MAPLSGVRVVDLSQMIGAPYCTQLLADLGADVIKVEEPNTALFTRVAVSPPGTPEGRRFSAYWVATNRNKRSMTLDLRVPEAREVLADLVRASDVVVENFGAHSRRSLGITEEWGLSVRADIIWASLSGYGRSGPEQDRDGWDLVAQARGGLLDMTGFPDGPPVKTGNSSADYLAGLHLAVGILGALHERNATGKGQTVDVSLLEPVLACFDGFPLYSSITGITPTRSGNFHPAGLPAYSVFPASDGYIAIGAAGPSFTRFMTLIERTDLDYQLIPPGAEERRAWFHQVVGAITEWCSTRTRQELHNVLDRHDIPNEPVRTLAEVWDDPQLEARDFYLEYEYSSLGTIRTPGSPIHLSRSPMQLRHVPPDAGEHNDDIIRDVLAYDDERKLALYETGALWGAMDSASEEG
jgi:crotonobetainyl-CoA:carnitine CoA-transferase CaiB-like acyl-CoA transferase